ncbi:MAG: dihydrolipoyl dehydrogenase [Anaerovoracaceae bacterium]|jgi:dihydrolipoamide dehydrogenase
MRIAIIGGGPGGYVAALRASILGAEVTLIEKNNVGGTCLNYGCIPTKALLQSANMLDTVNNAGMFGIEPSLTAKASFDKVMSRKDAVVGQLVSGIEFLLKKRNVKRIRGVGKLISNQSVEVLYEDNQSEVITADNIILATGSVPDVPKMLLYDGDCIITSDEALNLKSTPNSTIILGGGVIGCELGQFFSKMGSKVTIIEKEKHILPLEDEDISDVLHNQLETENVSILPGTKLESIIKENNTVKASLSNGETIHADCLLVTIGRKSNYDGIGVDEIGIKTKNGRILVNEKMETSIPGIYAIGDIVPSPQLAHVASKEGIVAVENIFGNYKKMDYKAIPRCIYTDPEIAAVGLTEREATERGIKYKLGRFRFADLGKSVVMGKTKGFVKIIADEEDCVIGGAIVGSNAVDLLNAINLAVQLGLTVQQLGDAVYPHPSQSEALLEALHDVHGVSVHSY